MKRAWIVGLLVVAGCGGEAASDTTAAPTSSAAPTTTALSRAAVGQAMAESIDSSGKYPWLSADPVALAEMGAAYCTELELSGSDAAEEEITPSMRGYLLDARSGTDLTAVGISADLLVPLVGDAAIDVLCPDLGSSKYLPPS